MIVYILFKNNNPFTTYPEHVIGITTRGRVFTNLKKMELKRKAAVRMESSPLVKMKFKLKLK